MWSRKSEWSSFRPATITESRSLGGLKMDLVTVGNYADLASAEVAASILESAGIECVIPDENLAGIAWQWGSALQGVRLQVADDNVELARLALEEPSEPAPAE